MNETHLGSKLFLINVLKIKYLEQYGKENQTNQW